MLKCKCCFGFSCGSHRCWRTIWQINVPPPTNQKILTYFGFPEENSLTSYLILVLAKEMEVCWDPETYARPSLSSTVPDHLHLLLSYQLLHFSCHGYHLILVREMGNACHIHCSKKGLQWVCRARRSFSNLHTCNSFQEHWLYITLIVKKNSYS